MVGPPNNHDLTTKSSTNDYCETDRGAFENCDNFFTITCKNAVFGQGKWSIFMLNQGKTTVFQHFCQGKRVGF